MLTQVFEQIIREKNLNSEKFRKKNNEDISNKIIDELINISKPEDILIPHQVQEFYIKKF